MKTVNQYYEKFKETGNFGNVPRTLCEATADLDWHSYRLMYQINSRALHELEMEQWLQFFIKKNRFS